MQGSVVRQVDVVSAFIDNVEPDNERLPQAIHSELNLPIALHGVRCDLDAALISRMLFPAGKARSGCNFNNDKTRWCRITEKPVYLVNKT